MKRKLFLTLLTSAALAGTQAGGMQNAMPRQDEQEQHVIASPNPTVDDSRTPAVAPGKISSAKVRPASATNAAPMKSKARPKRKRARKRRN